MIKFIRFCVRRAGFVLLCPSSVGQFPYPSHVCRPPALQGAAYRVFRTPKLRGPSIRRWPALPGGGRHAQRSHPASDSSSLCGTSAWRPLGSRDADARNNHARTEPRGGLKTPGLGRQEDADHGVGSAGRRHGGSAARSFLALCLGNAQTAWCGCAVLASRSLAEFDFQTRVGFNFFYDFVIAHHHIDDGYAPALGSELAQLVEV